MNLEIIHISKVLTKLHWKSYKIICSKWPIACVSELMIMGVCVRVHMCVCMCVLIWHVGEESFIL